MCGGYINRNYFERELGLEEQKKLGVCLCVISNYTIPHGTSTNYISSIVHIHYIYSVLCVCG